MKLSHAYGCARALGLAQLGRSTPLVVSFRLLNRCNLRCKYCYIPLLKTDELSTAEVLATLDGLKRAGTQYLNYTGGEPLLRDDIGAILAHTADLGFIHSLNTNGTYVPEKIDLLRRVSTLTLSLDGDEAVHDAARGRGTHREVMVALETARAHGIKVALTCVLSAKNLDAVDWLLATAERWDTQITFQPARLERLGSLLPDPITPPADALQRVMRRILEAKRTNPRILNSLTGLEHLAAFPAAHDIPCQAGRLYFRIQANGDVLACTDIERPAEVFNLRTHGLAAALARTRGTGCDQCWGASRVDFNYAAAFGWEAIANIARTR
ncbi:MAG: radical SAM protein [Candidatus Binatia bacterium]